MKINFKSLLKAGLVAGIVIILSAISMVPVVGNEMDTLLESKGLPPLSVPDMIYFCTISLIFGFSLVTLYVIVKEQFRPGIKTALIVSVIFWFLIYFISNVSNVVYGFMPVRLTVIGTIWGLGESLLAGIAGASLYRDRPLIT
ncbi:hypothetical protein MASR2M69_11800 [Bacteroidota bacterium]